MGIKRRADFIFKSVKEQKFRPYIPWESTHSSNTVRKEYSSLLLAICEFKAPCVPEVQSPWSKATVSWHTGLALLPHTDSQGNSQKSQVTSFPKTRSPKCDLLLYISLDVWLVKKKNLQLIQGSIQDIQQISSTKNCPASCRPTCIDRFLRIYCKSDTYKK